MFQLKVPFQMKGLEFFSWELESGPRPDQPAVGRVGLVLVKRSRGSPVVRRPVMFVAAKKRN